MSADAEMSILSSQLHHPHLAMSAATRDFVRNALTESTQRAFRSDISNFFAWGGVIPAQADMVANYLAAHAASHKPATLARWAASISKAHRVTGHANPTESELVRATLRGIRRTYGSTQRRAHPISRENLVGMLGSLGNRPKDLRDKALLLIGFAGGFRRSELVDLDYEDMTLVDEGLIVTIRRSKTDQLGKGRTIGIPYGRPALCPVRAYLAWQSVAKQITGPVFVRIDRHSNVSDLRLSGDAVCEIVRQRAEAAGMNPHQYTGHSLRSGLATSAARAGVPSWKIRQQTGHASDAMLARYVRDGEIWLGNAAAAVL